MSLTKKLNPKFTGLGKKFHGVVDPDQADASQAIAVGFQQIKEIFNITPQILKNVYVKDKSIIDSKKCKLAIRKSEKMIKNYGRMLVRKSGTEQMIRIMGESYNINLLKKCITVVKKSIT